MRRPGTSGRPLGMCGVQPGSMAQVRAAEVERVRQKIAAGLIESDDAHDVTTERVGMEIWPQSVSESRLRPDRCRKCDWPLIASGTKLLCSGPCRVSESC